MRRHTRASLPLAASLAFTSFFFSPSGLHVPNASAHAVGLSRGDYRFEEGVLFATLVFARGEVSGLVPDLDANRDGDLSAAEVSAARPALERAIAGGARVTSGGAPCRGRVENAALVEGDGLEITATWTCSAPAPSAEVELQFLDRLGRGHRHLLTLVGATSGAASFAYREEKTFAVPSHRSGPRVGAYERVRLAREGAAAALPPLALLLAILALGGARGDLSRSALAFAASLGATALLSARFGFDARFVAPGAGLAILFAGVDGFAAEDGRGRWIAALAVALPQGVLLARGIGEVAMPFRERPAAVLPYAAGAVLLLAAAGAAASPVLSRLSRAPIWPRLIAPALAAGLVSTGAWTLAFPH